MSPQSRRRAAANLATRIQHHPSRAALLPDLLARLDGLDPQIVADPVGPQRSSWRTHRACLQAIPPHATHLLVLQDDAIPCDNFAERARDAVAARPDRIVCLFAPGAPNVCRLFALARKRGEPFVEIVGGYVPLVATVYPRAHALAAPEYAAKRRIPVGRADDAVIAQYARSVRCGAVATVPCLVEHRTDVASAMGYRTTDAPHRRAAWLGDGPCPSTPAATLGNSTA